MDEDCVKISRPILYTFQKIDRQRGALPIAQAWSGRFGLKMYFNLFQFFLKVLELIESRRGDQYMTANKNFVHA